MAIVDVSVERMREDFEKIFLANVQTVTRVRTSESEAGNYGYVGDANVETRTEIQLNVQGITSNSYDRLKQGIDSSRSVFHCYARYDVDIVNTDLIEIDGIKYIIKGWNQSFKDGQVAFQEFDIESRPGQ